MNTFTSLKDFNKIYSELRKEIIAELGLGGKKVRLNGCIKMYVSINNSGFCYVSNNKTTMKEWLKMHAGMDGYVFKLEKVENLKLL